MNESDPRPAAVAVVGSPRLRGNTAALVGAVLDELERRGCRCSRIMLADRRVAGCDGHDDCADLASCPHDDDADAVLDEVYAADALILASPVYYENVSGQMKAFMDRNAFRYYHDEWLTARVVGLIAVAKESGVDDTLAALRRFVALSVAEEPPILTLGGFAGEEGAAAKDSDLMAKARALGAEMADRLGCAAG